jgi:hypothetical protein
VNQICQNGPCLNDGVCIDEPTGGYTCYCAPNYSGTNCQINRNSTACDGTVCQNGGLCTPGNNGYSCFCPPNYSGVNCEIDLSFHPCQSAPCQNFGLCDDTVPMMYTCVCLPGYTGTNCELSNNETYLNTNK